MKASKFLVLTAAAATMIGAIGFAHAQQGSPYTSSYGYPFPYQEGSSGNARLSSSRHYDSTGNIAYNDSTWNTRRDRGNRAYTTQEGSSGNPRLSGTGNNRFDR